MQQFGHGSQRLGGFFSLGLLGACSDDAVEIALFLDEQIAQLPPRDQLLAQVLASVIAPASSMVNLLGTVTSQFLLTLQAVADKRKSEEQE